MLEADRQAAALAIELVRQPQLLLAPLHRALLLRLLRPPSALLPGVALPGEVWVLVGFDPDRGGADGTDDDLHGGAGATRAGVRGMWEVLVAENQVAAVALQW